MHMALLYKNLRKRLNKAESIYTVTFISQGGPKELCWKLDALVPDISGPGRADHTGIATYRKSTSTSTQINPFPTSTAASRLPFQIHCPRCTRSRIHKSTFAPATIRCPSCAKLRLSGFSQRRSRWLLLHPPQIC
jgi:hypothetical protein